MQEIKYGWIPDPTNKQYNSFNNSNLILNNINSDIDLRPWSATRHNQGQTSTCTANATIKALEIKRALKYGIEKHVDLSRMDIYYGARERMSPPMTDQDNGTFIYLICEILKDFGVCREEMHPFLPENLYKKPSIMASREARLNRITSHFKIYSYGEDRLNDIIFNLQAGNPVIFGTAVGTDWQNYSGGKIGIDSNPKGLHAMTIVGYVNGLFIIENSWGNSWGDNGFAWTKPELLTHKKTQDIWVIVDGSENWQEK